MTNVGPRIEKIPDGDTKPRLVCPECAYVEYHNPKIVNAAVATYEGKFLLCRRAIEPRVGFWTLPGGFMENGETLKEGTLREAFEEATTRGNVGSLLAIYQPPNKNLVMMIFHMELESSNLAAGPESLEVKLFDWKDIPWDQLAFPMAEKALKRFDTVKNKIKSKIDFQPEISVLPPLNPVAPTSSPAPPLHQKFRAAYRQSSADHAPFR